MGAQIRCDKNCHNKSVAFFPQRFKDCHFNVSGVHFFSIFLRLRKNRTTTESDKRSDTRAVRVLGRFVGLWPGESLAPSLVLDGKHLLARTANHRQKELHQNILI